MVRAPVRRSSVCVFFLTLLISTYAINYPIALSLRPVDIILILFGAWGALNNRVRSRPLVLLIGVFYILYFLSTIYGVLVIGIISPQNFAFIYKYSVLFVCVWLVLSSRLDEQQARFLLKILFFSFLALITYEYISLYRFMIQSPESVRMFRPNFPFTEPFPLHHGGYLGDAHMLAAYVSTGLLALILCKRCGLFQVNFAIYALLLTVVFVGVLLTGSRNGIVTFFTTMVLFTLYLAGKKLSDRKSITRIRRPSFRLVCSVFVCGIIIVVLYMTYGGENDLVGRLLKRAFYFSLSEDQSYLGRVRKLIVACNLVFRGPVFLGVGLQSSPLSFFDGAIGSLLVSTGVSGIFVLAAIITVFLSELHAAAIHNQRQGEFLALFFVSINYIFANLVTEFFVVSRSVIPFAIFLGLTARLVHIPRVSVLNVRENGEGFDNNRLLQ